jgi:hypothetical protein
MRGQAGGTSDGQRSRLLAPLSRHPSKRRPPSRAGSPATPRGNVVEEGVRVGSQEPGIPAPLCGVPFRKAERRPPSRARSPATPRGNVVEEGVRSRKSEKPGVPAPVCGVPFRKAYPYVNEKVPPSRWARDRPMVAGSRTTSRCATSRRPTSCRPTSSAATTRRRPQFPHQPRRARSRGGRTRSKDFRRAMRLLPRQQCQRRRDGAGPHTLSSSSRR